MHIFKLPKLSKLTGPSLAPLLEQINPDCFPVAMTTERRKDGRINFKRREPKAMTRQDLARIYNQCGGNLHWGVLRRVLQAKEYRLDLNFAIKALEQITDLIQTHAIMIPAQRMVFIAVLGTRNDRIRVTAGEIGAPVK